MQKCDHPNRGPERWNLEVSHKMNWEEKICSNSFLNNKEETLTGKEKKFQSFSGLGALSTHVDSLNVRESKGVLEKGIMDLAEREHSSPYFS